VEIVTLKKPFASTFRNPLVKVDTIVLHATAGTSIDGAVTTLYQRGLGYHYLIGKSGKVVKGCAANRVTYHAGESVGPQGRWVNRYSVGIAFVNLNNGTDPYTSAQEVSVRHLIGQLQGQFPCLKWITSHAIISPGRKTDPRSYDLDRLARHVNLKVWRP
jgi:N-acetyl-anhydromuramyl-L-alanine amidase AmpD